MLSKTPTSDSKPRQYVGFDISREFFPSNHDSSFNYVQHNVLRPFPDEHLGKYDLVHARLLIAALKEDEIPIALENVLELLGTRKSFPSFEQEKWYRLISIEHSSWRLHPMGRVGLRRCTTPICLLSRQANPHRLCRFFHMLGPDTILRKFD